MIFEFRPHTPETWLAEYRRHIRVQVEWSRIQIKAVEVLFYFPERQGVFRIFYPWSKHPDQSWMDSEENQRVELGFKPLMIRAPALYVGDQNYLLLDCCHRIRDLNPVAIILDYLKVTPQSLNYFADLKNPFFQKIIRAFSSPEPPAPASRTQDTDRKWSRRRRRAK
jgi:hypothetical protein